jgi:hypothetical protein
VIDAPIDGYFWAEFWNEEPELLLPDVARRLSPFLAGLTAVNVSWDSGKLNPSEEQLRSGWQIVQGYAVTPRIDQTLTDKWPHSGCGFDEWYFFKSLPSTLEMQAFCNWLRVSLKEFERIAFKFDLREQLRRCQPELVLGEGYGICILAKDSRIVEEFRNLAKEKDVL